MIVIVGAGIAGLSLGRALLARDADVTIVEGQSVASGASGIATSYLEPRLGNTPMRQLERQSLLQWCDWAENLSRESGLDIHFENKGGLRVASAATRRPFDKDVQQREAQGATFNLLTRAEIAEQHPALSRGIEIGLLQPDVCWVDGARTCAALAKVFVERGGTLLENWCVRSVENSEQSITLNDDQGRVLAADTVVLANGMGANAIEGVPDDVPKCRAVRGVNLVVDQSSLPCPITRLIKHHRGNLCPRADNKLIVGTTYEADETNLEVSAEVIEKLYRNAEDVLPQVRSLPLLDVTSGIRCKAGDGTLRLGRSLDNPRVAWSLSHAGAGFLRAPLVSEELADNLLSGKRGQFIDAFLTG